MTEEERSQRPYEEDPANTAESVWHQMLTEANSDLRRRRHLHGLLPSDPRCRNCHRPFAGIGGAVLRALQGMRRSSKNPRYCEDCHSFATQHQGGAEIELTMLFVDVRGSTSLAERMDDAEFSVLMNRFYESTIRVLVKADAFIDKLVGDEVTALFIPGFAGEGHARAAVQAGRELLRVTGHARSDGPWIPVGVGVHTGKAWVGSIAGASGETSDFTALGDNVNVAARLASEADQGEALISEATWWSAGVDIDPLGERELRLKGKSEKVKVMVLGAT